jgi:hypothetical protein
MEYRGNVVLSKDNVSGEYYRRIIDFVESLTEEQRDMVHELQEMYEDVSASERPFGEWYQYDMMDDGEDYTRV